MNERPDPGVGSDPGAAGRAPNDPSPTDPALTDPVLVQRAKMQRFAEVGQRFGYSLFGIAVLLFFVGFPAGFPSWLITGIILCLAVGSIVLAPAIVIGYGVKAADREDRETGRT